jgi:hypothetical protein
MGILATGPPPECGGELLSREDEAGGFFLLLLLLEKERGGRGWEKREVICDQEVFSSDDDDDLKMFALCWLVGWLVGTFNFVRFFFVDTFQNDVSLARALVGDTGNYF